MDCSVTPNVLWRYHYGDPSKNGGTDYTHFPSNSYFLDLKDISKSGSSPMLEVPVTIIPRKKSSSNTKGSQLYLRLQKYLFTRDILNRFFPREYWLRLGYGKRKVEDLNRIVEQAIKERRSHVEFMIHSFDLMPGCNPLYPSEKHIDRLYNDIKKFFELVKDKIRPATMVEFYDNFKRYNR